jgi:ABC transporter DrrB family efflux protein
LSSDVITLPPPPATTLARVRWAIADGYTIARRNITHVRYVPERLINATVQPIMFVVLFSYVFGAAIVVPGGGNYRAFLMAGIFTQSLIFGFVTSAITMNDDMSKGVVDRFRSLPMARSAVLLGRTASDFVESLLAVGVMLVCGLFVGWRMENGVGSALAAFGLLLLLAYAMSWLGTWVGLIVRTPDAAQSIGFIVIFPLTFVANAFVPTEGMPGWMRAFANWNPVSATVQACRQLFGNPVGNPPTAWPLQHAVLVSVGWSLLILAVFVPLAVHRYRSAVSR